MPDMSNVRKNIARNILYYRKKMNLTQKDLADKLNVRNSAISNWEKEQNSPDITTLFDMCRVFGIDINEMCGFQESSSVTETLAPDEHYLIDIYRTLNEQGKEHIRICATSAQALFKEERSDISFMESKA